jgi:hypothetical protein
MKRWTTAALLAIVAGIMATPALAQVAGLQSGDGKPPLVDDFLKAAQ